MPSHPELTPVAPCAVPFPCAWGEAVLVWEGQGVRELHLPDLAARAATVKITKGGAKPIGDSQAASALIGYPLLRKTAASEGDPKLSPELLLELPIVSMQRAPALLAHLCSRIAGHLEGRLDDFLDVPILLPSGASPFQRAVWEGARQVPPGLTISYGELAEEIGRPGAARAVGSAMRGCPVELLIPAHRVIGAGRRPGGWTGPGGVSSKLRLLAVEGVDLHSK